MNRYRSASRPWLAALRNAKAAPNRFNRFSPLAAASSRVTLPAECTGTDRPDPNCTPTAGTVSLSATATDPDNDTLLYTWSTTGGRVTGDGPNATLDSTGVAPGTYTVTVEVDEIGRAHV